MPKLEEPSYSKEWESTETQLFDYIIGRDLSVLLRETSTEYNFLEIKVKVTFVIEQVRTLSKTYEFWAQLSDSKRTGINNALTEIKAQFESMELFDPKQNNAWDNRNNIVQNFISRYNIFYDTLVSALGAYLGQKAYSEELAGKFGQKAEVELKEIRRVKSEIEKVQVDVKEAAEVAGNIASNAHSVSFAEEAIEHKESASRWLKGLICVAGLSMLMALTVVYDIIRELKNSSYKANADAYIFKLALLAFLYIAIRFIIKNYSANKHLYVVNKQRSNILKSMEAFRTSAIDDQAKDTILLSAVGAAFAQQETGFITTKEGAGSDDGDILSIVNTALKKTGN